jgi:uncharacterized protein (DUF1697 family)
MRYAAFFRNLNLGRAGAPDRAQFEAAFVDAGASAVRSFQVNGSLLYDAASADEARQLLAVARQHLSERCGFVEPACCRSLATLRRLPLAELLRPLRGADVYELSVSFACAPRLPALELPLRNARGDAEIIWLRQGMALGLSRQLKASPGDPNRLLEQRTGKPFTSRSLGTIERLIAAA